MEIFTGTVVQVQKPQTMAPPVPPYTYFGVAQGLMPGLKILSTVSPTPVLALGLLAAHALECLLKAFLSRDGSDAALKKKDVRHNLNLLWEMACQKGLSAPTTPPDWVNCLSGLHNSPYYLRYSTGVHGVILPGAEPMTSELADLLKMVGENLSNP